MRIAHVERHCGRRLFGLHHTHKLVALGALDGQADVDHFNLLFESLHDCIDRLRVVIKLVHGQVDPRQVEDLISQFLTDLQSQLPHLIEGEVNCLDLGNVEQGKDLLVEIIGDAIVRQVQRADAGQ